MFVPRAEKRWFFFAPSVMWWKITSGTYFFPRPRFARSWKKGVPSVIFHHATGGAKNTSFRPSTRNIYFLLLYRCTTSVHETAFSLESRRSSPFQSLNICIARINHATYSSAMVAFEILDLVDNIGIDNRSCGNRGVSPEKDFVPTSRCTSYIARCLKPPFSHG